jgi:hypothetical protein
VSENSYVELWGVVMITQNYQTVIPAYGRDYKNKAEVETDFRAGKDFQMQSLTSSGYCSIRDFQKGVIVNVRYSKLTKVLPLKV